MRRPILIGKLFLMSVLITHLVTNLKTYNSRSNDTCNFSPYRRLQYKISLRQNNHFTGDHLPIRFQTYQGHTFCGRS